MKPEGVCFDASWRARSVLQPCQMRHVVPFIRRHYLRRRPGAITLCLRLEIDWKPLGMIVFALPPRETMKRYGGVTWELARLFIDDSVPRNAETWVIGKALRYIKRKHPDVRFIVSYADPSVEHTGVIYKASNFRLDGRTDDDRKSPRIDYVDANTGKHYSRRIHAADAEVVRKPRVSKFRYVMEMS